MSLALVGEKWVFWALEMSLARLGYLILKLMAPLVGNWRRLPPRLAVRGHTFTWLACPTTREIWTVSPRLG